MYNSCVSSTLTLKCKGPASFSSYDHSYCSTDRFTRHPLVYSSLSCCSCCANGITYRVPVCPSSLYGLRQSTLIQCKKLFLSGCDRSYSRFPAYDVDSECNYEKVRSFKENGISRNDGLGRHCSRFPACDVDRECNYEKVGSFMGNGGSRNGGVDRYYSRFPAYSVARERNYEKVGSFKEKGASRNGSLDRYCSRFPASDVDRACNYEKVGSFKGNGASRKGRFKCLVFDEMSEGSSVSDPDEVDIMLSLLTEEVDEELLGVRERNVRSSKRIEVEKRKNGGADSCAGKKKREEPGITGSELKYKYEAEVIPSRKEGKRSEEQRASLLSRESQRMKHKEEETTSLLRKSRRDRAREEEREASLRRETRRTSHKEEERASLLRERHNERTREEERESLSRNENHRQRLRKDGSSCSSYYSVSSTAELDSDREMQIENDRFEEESSGYHGNSKGEGASQYDGVKERGDNYIAEQGVVSQKDDSVVGVSGSSGDWRKKSEKRLTDISVDHTDSRKESKEMYSGISRIHGSNFEKVFDSSQKYGDAKQESTSFTKIDGQTSQHRQGGQSNTKIKHKQFVDTTVSHDTRSGTAYGSRKSYGELEETSSEAVIRIQQAREEYNKKVESIIREDEYKRRSNRLNQQSSIQQNDTRRESAVVRVSDTELKKKESNEHSQSSHVAELVELRLRAEQLTKVNENRTKNQEDYTNILNKSSIESKESSQARISDVRSTKLVTESHEKATFLGSSSTSTAHYSDTSTVEVAEANKRELRKSSQVLSGSSSIMESTSGLSTQHVSESSIQRGTSDFASREDALASVDRLQKFSTQYVGEFVEKAMHEISNSEILKEKKTGETKLIHDREQHSEKVQGQYSGASQPSEQESRQSSLVSGARGPSDEMWDVTEPSVLQEPPDAEVSEDADKDKKALAKRSGKSLWNIIGDIVHLRWMSHSDRHTVTSKSGGRSSPNQSTSSETWFSGYEAEDNNNGNAKGKTALNQESPSLDRHQIVRSHSHGEASSSSSSRGHMKVETSSPSIVLESSSQSQYIPLPSAEHTSEKNSEGTFGATVPEVGLPVPSTKLRRSPIIKEITEAGSTIPLPSAADTSGKNLGGTSSATVPERGPPVPSTKLRRSPIIEEITEAGSAVPLPSAEYTSGKNSEGTLSSIVPAKGHPVPSTKLRRSPIIEEITEAGSGVPSSSVKGQAVSTVLGEVSGSDIKDSEMEQRKFQRSDHLIKGQAVSAELPGPEVKDAEMKRRKFQRSDQLMTDRFDEWEEAYKLESEQLKVDEIFMREALVEARKAADNWEVPVGAVLVHDGRIVARGCNLVEELRDSTAHAEMLCIREASNILRTWRLSGTTLYVTLEPCPMCAGAILQARVDTVVWGAPNKLLGADGSWIRLFPNGDEGKSLEPTDKPPAPVHPFHPKITIRRGVLAPECADAMQQFFQLRRKKKDKKSDPQTPPSCLPISTHQPKFLSKIHDAFHIMFCL